MQDSLYNKQIETISNEELKKLQFNKLIKTLHIAKDGSKFYKGLLNNMDIDKFRNLNDVHNLPFTSKHDLINLSTYDNLACDINDLVEVHFSSGTTSNPIPSFMSQGDLRKSIKFLARTWHMQRVRSTTIFCMLAYYGLFSAGLLNHYAIQHLNAFVIPASSNSTDKTISLLKYFKVDTTAAVASYYLYLIEKMKQLDIDPIVFNLKQVILGGEPFSEDQRHYIENSLKAEVFDQYGLCEINTGLAGECKYHSGLHILADYAYPEIINPETLELCKEVEIGELVLTTLEKEASPLIRYRTGDMNYLNY